VKSRSLKARRIRASLKLIIELVKDISVSRGRPILRNITISLQLKLALLGIKTLLLYL